jgi:hypothetical protein
VLENGSGQVLQECTSLKPVVTRARAPIAERPLSLAARITLGLTGIRLTIDQKIEPMLAEFEEALLRVAPQLAAFV